MTIKNINEKFGHPVEFESVDEMADCINQCWNSRIDADDLEEGVDYEIIE